MADGDDWKGEGLIRQSTTEFQKASEVRRLVSKIYHSNRRKQGAPAPGAKKHRQFVMTAIYDSSKVK